MILKIAVSKKRYYLLENGNEKGFLFLKDRNRILVS